MGEEVGAEMGFQTVCPWVDPIDTRLGMSTGARRDGLAGVLTATELRGDMAESLWSAGGIRAKSSPITAGEETEATDRGGGCEMTR